MQHFDSCEVLRPAGPDCTGGGITARHDRVTVITDVPYKTTTWQNTTYYDRPDEVAVRQYCHKKKLDENKVLILCDKTNNPIYTPYLKPLDAIWGVRGGQKLVGPCAGGNYVVIRNKSYSDEGIYRVHDRYDTEEAWDALSR